MAAGPAVADEEAFIRYFAVNSDRGAALAAVSYLDHALGEGLKTQLVDDPKVVDPQFAPDRMFGGFGARLRLAYLTGVLKKSTFTDLNRVGDIRNEFGHKPELLDFNHQRIKGMCSGIPMLISIKKDEEESLPEDARRLVRKFKKMGFEPHETKYAFLAYCTVMSFRFMKLSTFGRIGRFDPF